MKVIANDALEKEHPNVTLEEQSAVKFSQNLDSLQGIHRLIRINKD